MKLSALKIAIMETMETIYCDYWLGSKAMPYFYNTPLLRQCTYDEIEFPFVLKYKDNFYSLCEYYDSNLIDTIAQTYMQETSTNPNPPSNYLEELVKDLWGNEYTSYEAEPSGLDDCITEERELPDDYVVKNSMHTYHRFSEV